MHARYLTYVAARCALMVAGLLLVPVVLSAQKSAPRPPYSLNQVVELVKSRVRNSRVLRLVRDDCIGFVVDSAAEAELTAAGADTALISALRSVCNPAAAAQDSIMRVREDSIKQAQADSIAQARADSIAQAQADSAARAQEDSIRRAQEDSIKQAQADSIARARDDSIKRAQQAALEKARQDSIARAVAAARKAAAAKRAAAVRDSIARVQRLKAAREARLRVLADQVARCRGAQCFRARYDYGRELEAAGRFFEALDEYRKAIRQEPRGKLPMSEEAYKAPIQNAAGRVLLREGVFEEAAGHFEKAVDGRDMEAPYQYNLGVAYECLNELKKAASAYKEAIRINPLTPGAREGLQRVESEQAECKPESAIAERFSE